MNPSGEPLKRKVRVDGHLYEVEAERHGGFARVLLLQKTGEPQGQLYGRHIAAKLFRPTVPSALVRRELTHWLEMAHPRIARLLGFATVADEFAAISPWYRRGTFEDIDLLPPSELISFGLELATGLSYALEEHRLVHLDLKPSNVFVADDTLKPVIGDWGIAAVRDASSAAEDGVLSGVGTLPYMAPERFVHGYAAHPSADVFSVGMMLVRLATATLPFREDAPIEKQLMAGSYLPLAEKLLSGLPQRVAMVILSCIRPTVRERPSDYRRLIRLLEA